MIARVRAWHVAVGYVLLALGITWPWAIHPRSTTFGVWDADLGAHISNPWRWADGHLLPFLPGRDHLLDAPAGQPLDWAVNLAAAPALLLQEVLAWLLGPIAAHGTLVVLAFALSAFAMFLLVRALTGHTGGAIVAGTAFGFWPYVYSTASQPLGDEWVIVLVLWRAVVALREPTVRNGLLLGAATAFGMVWIQYWLLIVGVAWAAAAVVVLVLAWRRGTLRAHLRTQAAAAAVIGAVALVVLAAGVASDFAGVPTRGDDDASRYSARIGMYVIPSPYHPILGETTRPELLKRYGEAGTNSTATAAYSDIYLGLVALALALVGAVSLWQRRRTTDARLLDAALLVGAVGVVALVWSAPPHVDVLGVSVPTPSAVLTQFTTAFRTTSRFAVLVMLAVALFAALGVQRLVAGRSARVAALAVAALTAVVFVDGWSRVPHAKPLRTKVFPTTRALAAAPGGIVAEYPLRYALGSDNVALFQQQFHEHPLYAGYRTGSASEIDKMGLGDGTSPATIEQLWDRGVRYVLSREPHNEPLAPDPRSPPAGLQAMQRDDRYTLYRVLEPRERLYVAGRSGLLPLEGTPPTTWRWTTRADVDLEVAADACRDKGCRRLRLSFDLQSFKQPRTVVLRTAAGRELWRGVVAPDAPTTLRADLPPAARQRLRLTTSPGPQPADDGRQFGVQLVFPLKLRAG